MTTYRPLPDSLTVSSSHVHGLGLHATRELPPGYDLGVARYHLPLELDPVIRTPLGGFVNHSNNPNCILRPEETLEGLTTMRLVTIQEIPVDAELTIKYTLYYV